MGGVIGFDFIKTIYEVNKKLEEYGVIASEKELRKYLRISKSIDRLAAEIIKSRIRIATGGACLTGNASFILKKTRGLEIFLNQPKVKQLNWLGQLGQGYSDFFEIAEAEKQRVEL